MLNKFLGTPNPSSRTKHIFVGCVIGFIFGGILEKSQVYQPQKIIDQMYLRDFRMMKMFLSAAGTMALVFGVLSYTKSKFLKPRITPFRLLGNILGGMILGTGMAIGGCCPGTMLVQLGALQKSGFFGVLGGIIAGLVYTFLASTIDNSINKVEFKTKNLADYLKISYTTLCFAFSIGMFCVVFIVKIVVEGGGFVDQIYLTSGDPNVGYLAQTVWSPVFCGILIGLLMLPLQFFLSTILGTATTFVNVANLSCSRFIPSIEKNKYAEYCATRGTSLYQFVQNIFMIIGAFTFASLSGTRTTNFQESMPVSNMLRVTFGGFLAVFGARLAGGCTSGHGLSGMSSQSISSYVVTMSIFAGGMGLANFILK